MHLRQVDLNLFVVLEAIYREGNITRAGQQLNLTQPAISHALKRLRDLLQDPLFVRQGQQMVPTPFTRNMIEQVRQALQILELNLSQSRNFVPEHARRNFHLSLWEYAEALILPSLLRRLTHAAPGMSITTSRVKRRNLETELASGAVDLAIDIPLTVSDRIRHKWLLNEPFVVIAREGHPAIAGELDLDTYLAQRHIQVSSRRHGPSLIDVELSRRGLRRQVFLRSQHNLTACMVVSNTDMLLTLPERHAQLLNTVLVNQVHPFPLQAPRLEAHLYWHESVENDPAKSLAAGRDRKGPVTETTDAGTPRKPGSQKKTVLGVVPQLLNSLGNRNDDQFHLVAFALTLYFWHHGQPSVSSGTDCQPPTLPGYVFFHRQPRVSEIVTEFFRWLFLALAESLDSQSPRRARRWCHRCGWNQMKNP